MKSWLGMVSMLRVGGGGAGRGRQGQMCPSWMDATPCCSPAQTLPPTPADRHLLWLRFSTSMFLAFSSSRGHSVSWL